MAVAPEDIDAIAQATAAVYAEAEQQILATVAQWLARGIDAPTWAEERLAAVSGLRRAAEAIVVRLQADQGDAVRRAIAAGYRTGRAGALLDLPDDLVPPAVRADARTRALRTDAMESLAAALVTDLGERCRNVLRHVEDVYRRTVTGAVARSITGNLTRRQASQAAFQGFIDQGVASFVDARGRTWRLSSYVEMAVRTVTQRAAVQGQTDRLDDLGIRLVYVSDVTQECERCRPFEGKVLRTDDGPTGRIDVPSAVSAKQVTVTVAASLDDARRRGFQHPNCRHSVRAYLPGATRLPTGPTGDPDGDVARQRQRAIERQIRKWKERQQGALDPAAVKASGAKVGAWQQAMREHLAANPTLKRLPYREQLGAGSTPPPGTRVDPARPLAGGGGGRPLQPEDLDLTPPEPAAPEPTPTEQVESGDFSALTRVGPQAGSNEGGLFEAADGSRWYVKSQRSEAHANNEALASALYREAGIDTPQVVRGRGTPGLSGEHHTASRLVADAVSDLDSRLLDGAYRSKVRDGFGVDAWLANWDTVGLNFDNVVTGGDGKPWRIDLGGSLLFRARGDAKGAAFGDQVTEWTSLRDTASAPQAALLFGQITRAEMVRAVRAVQKVTIARIRELAEEHGLSDLAKQLIARRKDLVDRLPELREEAKRHAAFDKRHKAALALQDALDAVQHQLTDDSYLRPAPAGWDSARVRQAESALQSYRGFGFEDMNDLLRSGERNARIERQIAMIDAVHAESTLPRDVVVYRGFRSPAKIFGSAWNDIDLVGLTWDDAGFASTSVDQRVAENFANMSGSVVMRIVQPKGTSAIRLSSLAPPDRHPSGIDEEAELLVPRGQRRRVVADHGVDAAGRRILDVEVID
ncbi:hypothetical protein J2S43_007866 [Catenuloplanes nepalensis]|uniref:ADP ribosyltransferase domain-containing protein n=1 Tax=Catenuloplanes nepalensis TaxID=587533 RepID=A0ABT9N6P1_9ACTN|nr:phage minor capsid protein [Catenuloplanes nepalensis]MDP9799354.1 hypothetical protein [Catenuloplanes nepalensis]